MFKVFGLVRLVADPELKEVGTTCVATFRVVSNEVRKNQQTGEFTQTPHFFECKAWDTGARRLCEKAHKGDQIVIEGQLRQESWKDKEGNNRQKAVVRVSEFSVIHKSKEEHVEEVVANGQEAST